MKEKLSFIFTYSSFSINTCVIMNDWFAGDSINQLLVNVSNHMKDTYPINEFSLFKAIKLEVIYSYKIKECTSFEDNLIFKSKLRKALLLK